MKPTTCETANFGGIEIIIWDMIDHQMTFLDPAFLLLRQPPEHLPQVLGATRIQRLPPAFGMKITWYLQSHLVWFRLCCSSIGGNPFRVLGGRRTGISAGGLP